MAIACQNCAAISRAASTEHAKAFAPCFARKSAFC